MPREERRTRVKLCGMTRPEDVVAVNAARPDYCGFVVNYPRSRRSLSPARAERLARMLDPGIVAVAVLVDEPIAAAEALLRGGAFGALQLHGSEDEEYLASLRARCPRCYLIKAFVVRDEADVARACQSSADMVLLDAGKGGGLTFDWSVTKAATRPFFLAGGLGSGNVAKALREVAPWGVDMSSGIETDGAKDPVKMMKVCELARSFDHGRD